MADSHAGPGDGVEDPVDVAAINIYANEDSHGSKPGERGFVLMWDGGEYDNKETWISCHEDAVADLTAWV